MSEAVSLNQPKDFSSLADDATFMVRQGGLVGSVDTSEVEARIAGGKVQRGSGTYAAGAGSVTFGEEYAAAPTVVVIPTGGNAHILATDNVATTGFDVVATDNTGAVAGGTFDWIAIG